MDRQSETQIEETNYLDLCRGCGGKHAIKPLSDFGSVFRWCTSIDVSNTDGLPCNICDKCMQMLAIAYQFKVLCIRTDKQLRDQFSYIENASSTENLSLDEGDKIAQQADETQPLEVTEETVSNSEEPPDEILELHEFITKETIQIRGPAMEFLTKDTRLYEKQVHSDEIVLSDSTEYLDESFMEICSSANPSRTVSIVVVNNSPKATNKQSHRFGCPECGKEFSSRTNMYRHQHTHRSSKPFKCDICKKEFTQSGSLKTHRYTHFNIKPFACNLCGQRFTQSKSVKFHQRRHTGEKPYACEVCNAAFRQKTVLHRHMKVHREHNRS